MINYCSTVKGEHECMKKKIALIILTLVCFSQMSILNYSVKAEILPDYEVPESIELLNGDFSEPLIDNDSYQFVNQRNVRGWMTTDVNGEIEMIRGKGGGHNRVVLAPSSKQTFAEINANSQGELYQMVNTTPGDVLTWSFDHSARSAGQTGDTIGVNIGASSATKKRVAQFNSKNDKWNHYTGMYVVPKGQTKTYFGFESVGTGNANPTTGNYITNVKFSIADVIATIEKSATNLTSGAITETNVDDELEYAVEVSNELTIKNGLVEDFLPNEISEPYDIMLHSYPDGTTGSEIEIPVEPSQVYDKATHKLSIKRKEINPEKTILTYKAKILDSASGKTITNTAKINGYDNHGKPITGKETSYDVTVKEVPKVTISYLNELGETIAPDKLIRGKVGESYQESPIEIDGYQYERVVGNRNGEFTETPQTIQFIYKENRFNLSQTVSRVDGSLADEVSLGENLSYSVEVKSELKEANPTVYYKDFTVTEPLDSSLEVPTDLQLVTSDGRSVGTVSYDPATHTITAKVTEFDHLNRTDSFFLTYQATVKEGLANETLIKEQATAEGQYTNGMRAHEKESNEVTSKVVVGDLIFESAPTQLNFGDFVKISQKEEKYPLNKRSGELSVKDLRGFGKQWSMTAKMNKPLTHSSGSELTDALYYQMNGREQVIGENQSALIHNEKTASANSVIITDTWTDSSNQPFIKTKAGETRRGEYKGVIQWSLEDVPTNVLP